MKGTLCGGRLLIENLGKSPGGGGGGGCLGENRGNFGTGVWKEIRKDWVTLRDNSRFLIGD